MDRKQTRRLTRVKEFLRRVSFPLFFVFQPIGMMPPISLHAER
jgi:hypothetical protein